jgi:hypothetical protein
MADNYLIICDERQRSYAKQLVVNAKSQFVTSEAEFETLREGKKNEPYSRIIIFAELAWEGKNYTEFFGIDVAVRLRMELRALEPVCILSFMPNDYFGKLTETKYNIMNARGSAFLQLPVGFDGVSAQLSTIQPLSAATLVFLSTSLIDIRHLIHTLNTICGLIPRLKAL